MENKDKTVQALASFLLAGYRCGYLSRLEVKRKIRKERDAAALAAACAAGDEAAIRLLCPRGWRA